MSNAPDARIRIVVDSAGAVRDVKGLGQAMTGLSSNAARSQKSVQQLGGAMHSAGSAVQQLRSLIAGLGVALGTRELIQYADGWKLIESRLRLVARSADDVAVLQALLFDMSQRTRQEFGATAELYLQVARNADELGRSQRELLEFTEAVQQALVVGGTGAQHAAAGLIQLSQALASGELRGDEFRSVMENMPGVSRAMAQGLGVTVGELRKMSEQGELTADVIVSSMLKMKGSIESEFAQMPTTVGQAFKVLTNEIQRFIGTGDSATDISRALAGAIVAVSRNLINITAAIGAAGTAWVVYNAAARAAVVWNGVLAGAQTIRAFVQLVRMIRSAADAMAVLQIVGKGAAGAVAAVIAGVVGFAAYRKLLKDIAAETDAASRALSDGLDPGPGAGPRTDEDALKKIKEVRAANEDMVRQAQQRFRLAGLEGVAQAKLAVEYEAVNKAIRVRRELTGELLKETLKAIDIERQWALKAVDVEDALERQNELLERQKDILKNLVESLQSSFADIFERMLTNSRGVLQSIKDLFLRTISEIMAASVMKQFAGTLAGLVGIAATGKPAAGATGDVSSVIPDHVLEPIIVKAQQSLLSKFIGYGGAAAAGGGMGYGIGQAAGNKIDGALGGALGGAAAGAAMGSVLPGIGTAAGAAAGALAGLVGGVLGAGKAAREADRAFREAMKGVNRSLREFVENAEGLGDFGQRLRGIFNEINAIFNAAHAAYEKRGLNTPNPEITSLEQLQRLAATQLTTIGSVSQEYGRKLKEIADSLTIALNALKQSFVDDLDIRLLRAQGKGGAADALELARRHQQELRDAELLGLDASQRALLDRVHAEEKVAQAAKSTSDAIRDVTSALNAPDGLRLSLFKWRATQLSQDTARPQSPTPAPGHRKDGPPATAGAVNVTINVVQQPGENGRDLAERVTEAFERKRRTGSRV